METGNVDLVLDEITADECNEAAEELAQYLDVDLPAARKLLAAFLNDLNNECLTRWGPQWQNGQQDDLSESDESS